MNIAKKDKNKMGKQFTILNVWGKYICRNNQHIRQLKKKQKKNRI